MQIAPIHIAIVGATGSGTSDLARALQVASINGDAFSHESNQWIVTEATALLDALTRELLFQDTSLYPQALHQHRMFSFTLLTGLDLPLAHAPDGLLSPALLDQRLRRLMDAQAIPYAVVYGTGQHRTDAALQAIEHHLGTFCAKPPSPATAWHWSCDTCSDADCEHQLFSRLIQPDSVRA